MATAKEQKITITASTGMTEEEIKNMVKDAETHAEEDRKKKEEIEVRNQLDNLIYGTEKTLNDSRDKVGADEARSIESTLTSAREAVNSGDVGRMRSSLDEVTKASHKLAETLYKQTTAGAQGPGPGQQASGQQEEARAQGGRGNDDVVDVEFEDVKK